MLNNDMNLFSRYHSPALNLDSYLTKSTLMLEFFIIYYCYASGADATELNLIKKKLIELILVKLCFHESLNKMLLQ